MLRPGSGSGHIRTESKSKIEIIINKALIGLWPKHVPLRFLGFEKMNDLQPNAKIKKLMAGNIYREYFKQF